MTSAAPRRVVYVNPCGEIGGAERALLLLLSGLDRERFAPAVVCSEEGRFTEALSAAGVPHSVAPLGKIAHLSRSLQLGAGATLIGGMAAVGALSELLKAVRLLKPDLIHTNGMKAHLLGGLAGRVLRRPVVWHLRDLPPEGGAGRLFAVAARCLPDRIVTVSNAVTDRVTGAVVTRKVRTVHDALDPRRVHLTRSRAAVRDEWGFPDDALILVMVAHFTQWKGHSVFLEALKQVRSAGVDARGVIVGGSIYAGRAHARCEADVRERASGLQLMDALRFTGYREDTADLIHAADILVHPPTRPEPFGLAVIEAMALGLPVVASDAGGVRETVKRDVSGILAASGDARAIAEGILRLAGDPNLRARMGSAGAARVERLFNPERHHAAICAIYEELLLS